MKISVVTINLNQCKFLEDTIISVISQSYTNFEYIIIDGGSNDESIEIIKKYENYLTYWVSENDKGPADALNKGFSKADGDYFYYLNADDRLKPNAFSKLISFIKSNPNFDIYYAHGHVNDLINSRKYPYFSDTWDLDLYLNGKISIFQPSTFISRNIFELSSGFNALNKTCWDAELLVDCSLNGAKFIRFDDFLSEFSLHNSSITGSQKLITQYQIDFALLQKKVSYKVSSNINIYLRKFVNDPKIFFLKIFTKIKFNIFLV